jgi:hypothetical protein
MSTTKEALNEGRNDCCSITTVLGYCQALVRATSVFNPHAFYADPDSGQSNSNILIRIRKANFMRICTDPDPKHQRAAKEYVSTIIKIYNSLDVKGYSL